MVRKGIGETLPQTLEQADENNIDVPLMFKQGGARIVYTKCDEDLMGEVFADLKESFDKIATPSSPAIARQR